MRPALLAAIALLAAAQQPPRAPFRHILVDASEARPVDPWAKAVGDLNGDGRPDLIVGGHKSGGLVWYENTGDMGVWKLHRVSGAAEFGTDCEVADVDRDGDNDLVVIRDGLFWFENTDKQGGQWIEHRISTEALHDIEVADLDGDGWLDVVARNQGEWGDGFTVFLYRQVADTTFTPEAPLTVPDGEGLLVVDLNRDSRPDIVVNGKWYENRNRKGSAGDWSEHVYGEKVWANTFLAAGDLNGDRRIDIVVSPAERDQHPRQRIVWFEAPANRAARWRERVIEEGVQPVYHFIGVADFDGDRRLDVVTAEMNQGADPDWVTVFLNAGAGLRWDRRDPATTGSHSMRIADLDGDGDPDLFGVNWNSEADPRGAPVEIWINELARAGRRP
jgi:hypothetical protein